MKVEHRDIEGAGSQAFPTGNTTPSEMHCPIEMEEPIIFHRNLMGDKAGKEALREAFLTIAGGTGKPTGETANAKGEPLIQIILAFIQRELFHLLNIGESELPFPLLTQEFVIEDWCWIRTNLTGFKKEIFPRQSYLLWLNYQILSLLLYPFYHPEIHFLGELVEIYHPLARYPYYV
jgi:hypothetical protein